LCWNMQGFFGRSATQLINDGYITKDGKINWDLL